MTLLPGILRLRLGRPLWLAVLPVALAAPVAAQQADGALLFARRCSACHAIEPGATGSAPNLAGVIGRAAGSAGGASTTEALRDSGIVWTVELVARFIEAPRDLVPGTRMTIRLPRAEQRSAIADFLATTSAAQETQE